jgi:hypothetical protein
MTLRLTSTAETDVSDPFSPAGDFCVQVDSAIPAVVDIEARVDEDAAWVGIASIRSSSDPITPLIKLPFVRYRLRGNTAGNTVNVSDNG